LKLSKTQLLVMLTMTVHRDTKINIRQLDEGAEKYDRQET
jgi:hypothetical protein